MTGAKHLLLFAQKHENFRIAEIEGVCKALNIPYTDEAVAAGLHNSLSITEYFSREQIELLLSRCVLLKAAFELLFTASSGEEARARLASAQSLFARFDSAEQSWATRVRSVGRKKGLDLVRRAAQFAECFPLATAPIDLRSPRNKFVLLEVYESERATAPSAIHCLRELGEGQYPRVHRLNLQDRCYIGNTTMDPALALIQANIAAVGRHSLALDPFCGTAGLLIAAAEFGANVLGTELNWQIAYAQGRSARAGQHRLTPSESIANNFEQYGLSHHFLGVIIADASAHDMWTARPLFDAIVSDPPYGVREKCRKLGPKQRKDHWTLPMRELREGEVRFPQKARYTLDAIFTDILDLAARSLVVGGRLSFWFPVVYALYSEEALPSHPALALVSNCEQPLTLKLLPSLGTNDNIRTSRRLLTYEKVRAATQHEHATVKAAQFADTKFRDAVFASQKSP